MFDELEKKYGDVPKDKKGAKIKVIGVGGGGANALEKMMSDNIQGVDFYVVNTDTQALGKSSAPNKIALGLEITKGLGAGADPDQGARAAIESIEEIREIVEDTDLIFITAGMGGGTGSGAASIIAKAAKESGALVVAIVTTPFLFEGKTRENNAKKGLEALDKQVDSIIVISNNKLLKELGKVPISDSFQYSDAVLKQAVRTIADLINNHSLINLDFADVKTTLENKGLCLIGTGKATGENATVEAAIQAINSPILDSSIDGAQYAIINVLGASNVLTLRDAEEAVKTVIESSSSESIDVIFGVTLDDSMGEEIFVSVIATGLNDNKQKQYFINLGKHSSEIKDDETNIQNYREDKNSKTNKSDTGEFLFAGLKNDLDENDPMDEE